ncbi:MAG: NAD(P)(+) transhydrogenase (Re/Si-specific) subunit beta [Candidatus Electryonea clarkiae]|nr:NAD(P)(+) transhydrogenase (Re/Si-specific) subunit beta [Candidatus Electryonea clarkiae]
MLSQNIVNIAYVIAAIFFIMNLKWLSHPRTAVKGNRIGALGMLIAIAVTLLSGQLDYKLIIIGVAIGSLIGAVAALRVSMTSMPEMVGLFNGFGGGASIMVAGAALVAAMSALTTSYEATMQMKVATVLSGIIGSVTFFGSYVAFGKLAEFIAVKWKLYLWQNIVKFGFSFAVIAGGSWYAYAEYAASNDNLFLAIALVISALLIGLLLLNKKATFPGMNLLKWASAIIAITLGVFVVLHPENGLLFWVLVGWGGVLGVILTLSIGGADMPVVIALLNSYSGLAACATGFVINNNVLIIAGSLVGASGIILTKIMCKAMNRSLANVLFGTMGPTADTPDADEVYKTVKSTSGDEIAMLLETAQKVVFVPGYGMAVSQAQHVVRDLGNMLEEKFGTEVEYSVHPVAGRMPGHMNVLLAEANVDYDKLKEMDETNMTISQVDVCIVVGANDVVNPVARTDPKSPIAGMPIIDVDKAKTCIVIKRSLAPGFAGIPNPLFAMDNTLMFFNDGKKAFMEIIEAVKEV